MTIVHRNDLPHPTQKIHRTRPNPSRVKRYLEREKARLKHQGEVARVFGYGSFASAEAELVTWVDAQAWMAERTLSNDVTDRPVPDRRGASDVRIPHPVVA